VQKREREYNTLNRLTKDIGGVDPATQITQYGYDTQGNLTTITDPLGIVTTNEYDELNRLKKMIDPAASGSGQGAHTQYAYDGLDQLTQVSDPRSLATGYTLDGLGNLTQLTSPDTGTATRGFDAAGNLTGHTDARGVAAVFTYDALNRLTQAVYTPPGGSGIAAVTLTYSYDQGTYGKGHLTGFTDPSGSTSHVWNQKGRLGSQTRTIGGTAYTTQYDYDPYGRLYRVTYPSGRTLDYGFDGLGRIQQIDTTYSSVTQPIVSSVAYHPFGGMKSFTFGNATSYSRSVDLDGRISGYTLATLSRTLGFDADSRISGYTHNQSAYDQSFGYDNLDRLSTWTGNATNQAFGYDATGNRTSLTVGASTYPHTVQSTSNRVTQTNGPGGVKSFGFDAAGNTTGHGSLSFSYDVRGRMIGGTTLLGAASYQVNALGQRVVKPSRASPATTTTTWESVVEICNRKTRGMSPSSDPISRGVVASQSGGIQNVCIKICRQFIEVSEFKKGCAGGCE
jgi:YD repeat-containing protein